MKIKPLLMIISFALPLYAVAETVYKTRDAEGNIIFSDVPSVDAETIEIEEAQTINIPQTKNAKSRQTVKLTPKEMNYTKLEITSPENDATIRSNEGKITVTAELVPALDDKHVIVFLMDGKEMSSGKSLQLTLKDIDRGTHAVTVLVKNENDKVLKSSDKLTFHLRKDSKLFKNRTQEKANSPDSAASVPTPPPTPAL